MMFGGIVMMVCISTCLIEKKFPLSDWWAMPIPSHFNDYASPNRL